MSFFTAFYIDQALLDIIGHIETHSPEIERLIKNEFDKRIKHSGKTPSPTGYNKNHPVDPSLAILDRCAKSITECYRNIQSIAGKHSPTQRMIDTMESKANIITYKLMHLHELYTKILLAHAIDIANNIPSTETELYKKIATTAATIETIMKPDTIWFQIERKSYPDFKGKLLYTWSNAARLYDKNIMWPSGLGWSWETESKQSTKSAGETLQPLDPIETAFALGYREIQITNIHSQRTVMVTATHPAMKTFIMPNGAISQQLATKYTSTIDCTAFINMALKRGRFERLRNFTARVWKDQTEKSTSLIIKLTPQPQPQQ